MRVWLALMLMAVACPSEVWGQSRKFKYGNSELLRPEKAWLPSTAMPKEAQGRYLLNHFASCVIDAHRNKVRTALSLQPGKDLTDLARAASADCLLSEDYNDIARFPPALLRGAFFGELYRRHVRGRGEIVKIEELDFTKPLAANASKEAVLNLSLLALADCVYQQQPETVRTIVTKPTYSVAQKKAYTTVVPLIQSCVPQDKELALSLAVIESAFGEYLYRSLVPVVRTPAGKAP